MCIRRNRDSLALGLAASVAAVGLETAVCWFLLNDRLPDIVMVYLLGVVLLAVRFGYAASLPATVLSVAAVDFFFTVPYFSFDVADKRLLLTFVLMGFVASVISNQTERIRRREIRTSKLYAMSRELSVARATDDMANVADRHVRDAFGSEAWLLFPDGSGGIRNGGPQPSSVLPETVLARAGEMIVRDATVRADRDSGVIGAERLVALHGTLGIVGVLVVRPPAHTRFRSAASRGLLDAFAGQIALAVERARFADEAQRAQLEVQKERLRNALLSSVSHDLKTPLGVIKGAVTALIEQGNKLPPGRHGEYLHTISAEATRLNRLLRNLLAMTSLEAGAIRVRREWQPLEEIVGVALNRLEEQLENRPVQVRIASDASLVSCDATLLEQVLINLVENATKYTPPSSPIRIVARRSGDTVEVEVADSGDGVAEGQREAIFEKFHRAATKAGGMGLGLTICRGIVTAHGGRIWCENRDEGGASFRFTLPLGPDAPAMKELPEVPHDA
jgi:two-component system sensor histidine kinase KdpD